MGHRASGSVITQCPHCSISFRVSDAQLGATNGAVCCGICLKVFSVLQHQVGSVPRANAPSTTEAKPAVAPPPAPSVTAATSAAPPVVYPHDEALWIHNDLDLDSLDLDEELAKLGELELSQGLSSIEKAPRPTESLLVHRDDERDPRDERRAEALIVNAEPAQPACGNPCQEPNLGESPAEERVFLAPLRRVEDLPELYLSLDDDDDDGSSLGKRRHGLSVLDEGDEESTEEQSVVPLGNARKPDEASVESLDQLRDEPS